MSHIKSVSNPEEIVRKYLFAQGFRFRKNDSRFSGKPDIVLPMYKTIVFINGCFWHQHPGCKKAAIPKTNIDYWTPKLQKNVLRDKKNNEILTQAGWRVLIIWECTLAKKNREETLSRLNTDILSGRKIKQNRP